MKRSHFIVAVLSWIAILGIIGGVYWWSFKKPVKRSITEYLPSNTLFYATIPNATSTLAKYQKSHLKEVLESKELKALSLLISDAANSATSAMENKFLSSQDLTELKALAAEIAKNSSGESFLAVTKVNIVPIPSCEIVLGIRPNEGKGDPKALTSKLKSFIDRKKLPLSRTGESKKGEISYQWWEVVPLLAKICFAEVDGWMIITMSESALEAFIDSYQDPKFSATSLQSNRSFQEIQKRLGPNSDALFFINFEEMINTVFNKIPEEETAKILTESYKQFEAAGWGISFVGPDLSDRWVILSPKGKRPDMGAGYKPCAYKTLTFTSSDTLIYLAQNYDLQKAFDYSHKIYQDTNPMFAQALDQVEALVSTNTGLDFKKNILAAMGPEISFQLDWPAQAVIPEAALFLEIAQGNNFKPTAEKIIQLVKTVSLAEANVTEAKVEQNQLVTITFHEMPQISPTLVLNDRFFGVFLTEAGARRILTKSATNTLSADPEFKALATSRQAGSTSLWYAHTPRLLQKTYGGLKSALESYSGMIPRAQGFLEAHPMPDSLSFAEACGPWVLISKIDDQAFEIESISGVGNLALSTGFTLGLAGGIAVPSFIKARSLAMASQNVFGSDSAGESGDETAQQIRNDLQELRIVIESWAKTKSISKGTPIQWESLNGFFIPGSDLEKSDGLDRAGNRYVLGVVGETLADVSPETKKLFVDAVAPDFWMGSGSNSLKNLEQTGNEAKLPEKSPDPKPFEKFIEKQGSKGLEPLSPNELEKFTEKPAPNDSPKTPPVKN